MLFAISNERKCPHRFLNSLLFNDCTNSSPPHYPPRMFPNRINRYFGDLAFVIPMFELAPRL